jgi:hypothetical protein
MHIWTLEKWKEHYDLNNKNHRSGLRLRFDNGVDLDVKRSCKEFCNWLRKEYFFPIRIPIYIKSSFKIKSLDGDYVSAIFFRPNNVHDEPYASIATGDYREMLVRRGKDNALAAILFSIAHELTHYYQWINDIKLTEIGIERQATSYSKFVVYEYAETKKHP